MVGVSGLFPIEGKSSVFSAFLPLNCHFLPVKLPFLPLFVSNHLGEPTRMAKFHIPER